MTLRERTSRMIGIQTVSTWPPYLHSPEKIDYYNIIQLTIAFVTHNSNTELDTLQTHSLASYKYINGQIQVHVSVVNQVNRIHNL